MRGVDDRLEQGRADEISSAGQAQGIGLLHNDGKILPVPERSPHKFLVIFWLAPQKIPQGPLGFPVGKPENLERRRAMTARNRISVDRRNVVIDRARETIIR